MYEIFKLYTYFIVLETIPEFTLRDLLKRKAFCSSKNADMLVITGEFPSEALRDAYNEADAPPSLLLMDQYRYIC